MWDRVMGVLPENLILLCAVLSFLIPYAVYKVNQKLHKYGDPPWKDKGYRENQKIGNKNKGS
ncbi:hypothetical protein J11TS1_34250 [Oceanobacillus sp. J11TS1]|nr:hypothetical protein J11TS1_34250 [Oceanobacillus sp. J11TS1]